MAHAHSAETVGEFPALEIAYRLFKGMWIDRAAVEPSSDIPDDIYTLYERRTLEEHFACMVDEALRGSLSANEKATLLIEIAKLVAERELCEPYETQAIEVASLPRSRARGIVRRKIKTTRSKAMGDGDECWYRHYNEVYGTVAREWRKEMRSRYVVAAGALGGAALALNAFRKKNS